MSDSNTTRRAATDWIEAIEEACADPAAGPVTGVEDAMAAFEREEGRAPADMPSSSAGNRSYGAGNKVPRRPPPQHCSRSNA